MYGKYVLSATITEHSQILSYNPYASRKYTPCPI